MAARWEGLLLLYECFPGKSLKTLLFPPIITLCRYAGGHPILWFLHRVIYPACKFLSFWLDLSSPSPRPPYPLNNASLPPWCQSKWRRGESTEAPDIHTAEVTKFESWFSLFLSRSKAWIQQGIVSCDGQNWVSIWQIRLLRPLSVQSYNNAEAWLNRNWWQRGKGTEEQKEWRREEIHVSNVIKSILCLQRKKCTQLALWKLLHFFVRNTVKS